MSRYWPDKVIAKTSGEIEPGFKSYKFRQDSRAIVVNVRDLVGNF
jgi:hypothetical protein